MAAMVACTRQPSDSSHGILVLDKPAGISSAAAIAHVKRAQRLRKIGHAGTLDPFATGVLVCLVGRATKLASFVQAGAKMYSGTIELGTVTDSDDSTGNVCAHSLEIPPFEMVVTVAAQFRGVINQVPPRVSACKVAGERAYRLARAEKDFELKPKQVEVSQFDLSATDDKRIVKFIVRCSSGTYIRALARDLGSVLGCGGCLRSLRRDAVGGFTLEQAGDPLRPETITTLPWWSVFPGCAVVDLPREHHDQLLGGDQRMLSDARVSFPDPAENPVVLFAAEGSPSPSGVLQYDRSQWRLVVGFPELPSVGSGISEHRGCEFAATP